MSCEDYCPELDNDYDESETNDTFEEYVDKLDINEKTAHNHFDGVMKKLIKEGGLRVENIIEIQYMIELIKHVPENYRDKQQSIAKCLELIINLANQFLYLYDKQTKLK
jgi:hypothetical protein